jgi:hypothetical protein
VFGVLPDIKPGVTFCLSLGAMMPFLVRVFRRPGEFVDGIVACAFASFLFGWVYHIIDY